jgi:hypothetical protein
LWIIGTIRAARVELVTYAATASRPSARLRTLSDRGTFGSMSRTSNAPSRVNSAAASSLMVGRIWPTDREVIGEYADSFRREGGAWRFSERIYTIWRAPD